LQKQELQKIERLAMNPKVWWECLLCLCFMLLVSCAATVPLTTKELDAEGKLFSPPNDKANLYVVRGSGLAAHGVLFQVIMDGEIIGAVAPATYLLIEVEPGNHKVSVIAEQNQELVEVEAETRRNYFVEVRPKVGLTSGHVSVVALDDTTGRALVEKTKRAQSANPK